MGKTGKNIELDIASHDTLFLVLTP